MTPGPASRTIGVLASDGGESRIMDHQTAGELILSLMKNEEFTIKDRIHEAYVGPMLTVATFDLTGEADRLYEESERLLVKHQLPLEEPSITNVLASMSEEAIEALGAAIIRFAEQLALPIDRTN